MYLQWFGQSFFKLTVKNEKGEEVVIAIDPFDKETGLKLPNKFGADITLITHDHHDHNNLEVIKGTELSPESFIISGPGEYEVKGVMIYGIASFHDNQQGEKLGENTIYLLQAEEVWLAHLGDLGQKTLTDTQLEQLQGVDVVLIPIGGEYTINAPEASAIIAQLEPRVVIPMHYALAGLKSKLDDVQKFIKEMGLKTTEPQEKLKIQKKDLPQEETRLILLQA